MKNGKYYIGVTGNIEKRMKQHNAGESKSTRAFAPYELVYTEKFLTFSEARKRESYIKKRKSRRYIEELVN